MTLSSRQCGRCQRCLREDCEAASLAEASRFRSEVRTLGSELGEARLGRIAIWLDVQCARKAERDSALLSRFVRGLHHIVLAAKPLGLAPVSTHQYKSIFISTHLAIHISTHKHTPVHISTHQYTSVYINTHQSTSVQITPHQYTPVHISTHQYTSAHISTHQYSSVHTRANRSNRANGAIKQIERIEQI